MPHYLKKGAKQHTTIESNESRMVTKVRWIVESRNGHLKTVFKFFDKQVSAGDSEHVAEYFKIACALLNAFYPVIIPQDDTNEVAQRLIGLKNTENHIQKLVADQKLVRKNASGWAEMQDVQLEEFPRLDMEDLRFLTIGVYQLKQSKSYTAETLDRDGTHTFLWEN